MEAHIAHLEASSVHIYKNTKIEKLLADEEGHHVKEILTKNQKPGKKFVLKWTI